MPTKRFETTTETGLRAIVARRGELEDRGVIAQRLRQRKIANTKTSIVFGFDNDKWETDAMSRQKVNRAWDSLSDELRRHVCDMGEDGQYRYFYTLLSLTT